MAVQMPQTGKGARGCCLRRGVGDTEENVA